MGVKTDKRILDVTCGGRSIWFNKNHHLALYCDRREEEYEQTFGKAQPSTRHIKVHPDMIADFTDLPFDDNTFNLVVFDPPHIISEKGNNRWLTKAYGHYKSKEEALESVRGGTRMFASAKALWDTCYEMGRNIHTNSRDNQGDRHRAIIWTEERKEKRNKLDVLYERAKRTVKVLV